MATRGTYAWRKEEWGEPCSKKLTQIRDWLPGININIDPRAYEAFTVMADIIRLHGYEVESDQTGSYNCRYIKGTKTWSNHAWGLALDLNWRENPWSDRLVTDMPLEMVRDILDVETTEGVQVFRWGGDWDDRPETDHSKYDAMHWEMFATPAELAKGISYSGAVKSAVLTPVVVAPAIPDTKPEPLRSWEEILVLSLPTLSAARTPQKKHSMTKKAQALLNTTGYRLVEDGYFGEKTDSAVRRYQSKSKLASDGAIGPKTWTSLLS